MAEARKRVVITGLGTVNPLGLDTATTWENVAAGKSGVGCITLYDASDSKVRIAAEVKAFDASKIFGRREARRMGRATQFAVAAANEAIADAQLPIDDANRDRIGVVIGTGMGSVEPIVDAAETALAKSADRVSPFFVSMMLGDTPAGLISIGHGLCGPNMSISTACATGNNSLGEAAAMIRRGVADVMVAGSTDGCIVPVGIGGFAVMGALSTRNDTPEIASRPFDADRDGFVTGEGAGVLILESLEHAQARGAKIYAEFLGYGTSADAYHITQPQEDGAGAVKSMRWAMEDAGLTSAEIGYINAHGTSTELNDKMETAAIKALFGDRAYDIPVSSTKSMHGHLLGAAGALEAVICTKALEAQLLPPTINYTTPDPNCDLDYVPNEARAAQFDTVMSNGFGFGGHNATIILGSLRDA